MTTARLQRPAATPRAAVPTPAVDIVVPVHNESAGLVASVFRLYTYLVGSFPFTFRVTIVDNGSTDGTWELARELAHQLTHVRAIRLDESGRRNSGANGLSWSRLQSSSASSRC